MCTKRLHYLIALLLSMVSVTATADNIKVSDAPTSEGWGTNTYWYYIQVGYTDSSSGGNKYAGYWSTNSAYMASSGLNATNTTKPTDAYGFWCIVGDDTNGYSFYNLGEGTGKVLGISGSEANAWMNMYDASTTTSGVFTKFEKKASNTQSGCYCFRVLDGSTNNWLNNRGGHYGEWAADKSGPEDNGSAIKFITADVADLMGDYSTLLTLWQKIPSGAIGAPTDAQKAELQTACNSNDYSAAKTLVDAFNDRTDPTVPDGYYRILNSQHVSSGKYRYLIPTDDGTTIVKTSGVVDSVKSVVKIVKNADSDDYSMSINGRYFGKRPGQDKKYPLVDPSSEDAAGKFTFKFVKSTGLVNIIEDVANTDATSSGILNSLHSSGDDDRHEVVAWTETSNNIDEPSGWFLIPASEAKIDLNAVSIEGEDPYIGTAYLSFDATTPDEAKAYLAGEASGGSVPLTASTEIPAGQGVIITATTSPITIKISGTASEKTSTLSGTYFPIELTDDNRSSYLVLGLSNEDNSLGLFQPSTSISSLAMNKAFWKAETATIMSYNLNFGAVTAINNAVEAGNASAVYDLSGRRVLSPTKGGIYIKNGKKYVK